MAGVLFILSAFGFGGCAQSPQQIAAAYHGREYFPSSVYGPASRRVIADGQPIPHGGGQYLVGKPYTVAGQTYYPSEHRVIQVGNASWYGDAFHGRLTANGEIYDRDGFTAAHPTMPLPSYARVTNLRNNYSMIVRVNDRGPYASNRVMDVSRRVAEALDFKRYGTAKVKVEYVGRASLAGSDDARLFATLRTTAPAPWQREPTMVADAQPRARVASLEPFVPAPHPLAAARRPTVDREDIEPPRARRYEPVVATQDARPTEREVTRQDVTRQGRWDHGRLDGPRDTFRIPPQDPVVARGMDTRHRTRLASRDDMPHLPIRDLLQDDGARGHVDVGHLARGTARPILPPSRPLDLGTIPGAASQIELRHRAVDLRTARYRDD